MPTYHTPQQQFQPPQNNTSQFSPNAQQNAMLYTPLSIDEDEGHSDSFQDENADFQLFDSTMQKPSTVQPLFGEIPSADMGFSQNSQDIFQQIDLSQLEYPSFQE
jgi:hypothetical protein